jgi:hypothetical protein
MAVRTCKVTYVDGGGIEHVVTVSGQTLYEAIAQALRIFREQAWCEQDLRHSAASVVVKISQPTIEHRVKISDFEAWLSSSGRSPAEMSLKNRLRDIVDGQSALLLRQPSSLQMLFKSVATAARCGGLTSGANL